MLFVSAPTMEALNAIRPDDASAGDSLFGLSDDQIGRRVTAAAAAAGLGEGFTGHSARVGMAQDLARCWDGIAGIDDGGEVAVTDDARQIHPCRTGWARCDCGIL